MRRLAVTNWAFCSTSSLDFETFNSLNLRIHVRQKKTALLSMKYCLLNRDLYDNPCISGYMIQPPILYTLNFLIAHFKDQPSNKTLFASLILWDLDTWGHGVSKKEPLDRRFVNLTRLWREMCKLYLVIQSYVHVCLGYDQPNHRQLMST